MFFLFLSKFFCRHFITSITNQKKFVKMQLFIIRGVYRQKLCLHVVLCFSSSKSICYMITFRKIRIFLHTLLLQLTSGVSGMCKAKCCMNSQTYVKRPLSKRQKIGFQDQLSLHVGQTYCRMISEIHPTFIKLPFVIKIFVLSIFEWPFYTGFTVWCCTFHHLVFYMQHEHNIIITL